MLTLVASALAGGDCIDDADALRAGRTASAIGCVVKAPSTLRTDLDSTIVAACRRPVQLHHHAPKARSKRLRSIYSERRTRSRASHAGQGTSLGSIAAELNTGGVPPVSGKIWNAQTVRQILCNRAYTGVGGIGRNTTNASKSKERTLR